MNKDDYVPHCKDDANCLCAKCEDFYSLVKIIDKLEDPEDKELVKRLAKVAGKYHHLAVEFHSKLDKSLGYKKKLKMPEFIHPIKRPDCPDCGIELKSCKCGHEHNITRIGNETTGEDK